MTYPDSLWEPVDEGTPIASINKTTGEFKVLLDKDAWPGSRTFHVTASSADGTYTKTDRLFISYRPVEYYLENTAASDITESHIASFTKGVKSTVTVKPVIMHAGEQQTVTEDVLKNLTLYYGRYPTNMTISDADVPVESEYFTKTYDVDAGTVTFEITMPEDSAADHLFIYGEYEGPESIMGKDGKYSAYITVQSTSYKEPGLNEVRINDYSGSEGKYTPGEYTKVSLGAEASDENGNYFYATYEWGVTVDGSSSDLVKIKHDEGSSEAELWILGLTEGDITVMVVGGTPGEVNGTTKEATYKLTPAAVSEEPIE